MCLLCHVVCLSCVVFWGGGCLSPCIIIIFYVFDLFVVCRCLSLFGECCLVFVVCDSMLVVCCCCRVGFVANACRFYIEKQFVVLRVDVWCCLSLFANIR